MKPAKNKYTELVSEIRLLMEQARQGISQKINTELLLTYWHVGRLIVQREVEESIDKLITNPIERERARKFMHHYSHMLTTESFMKFPDLAECSDAIRIVLEAVEKHDPTHYKSLTERAII